MTDAPATTTATGTVVFTDLVGFTQFNDAMGDGEAVAVLDQQLTFAAAAVERCGRVVKELGDGLMWWVPDPAEAIDAALEFLALVDEARWIGRFPLSVRAGLHHGDVVPRGDDLIGHTVNVAARIADLAGPGELLASEMALAAADRSEGFVPVGPATVKGVAAPIWLHRAASSADQRP